MKSNLTVGWWLLLGVVAQAADSGRDWPAYLGDRANTHRSSLAQIHRGNVGQLQVAWQYSCEDPVPGGPSQIQCNPLIIDGVLYGTSGGMRLFALDAGTGRQRWVFDPFSLGGSPIAMGVNRGLVFWKDGNDRRILLAVNNYLYAVNATNGEIVKSFGDGGRIDLKQDLGRDDRKLALAATTPGVLFGDLLIMGMRVGEGPGPAALGPIRAYNVRTGKLVWRFNTIPFDGEFGHETWSSNSCQFAGGANVWAGFALDEERGIVFCPTGSASFDFWGGDRLGQNLFADCLIALDARTGKRLWHFQFIHHDLWDRDLGAPPNLLTVQRAGKSVPAVAQVTKSGHVFVFNRVTGEPLFPIHETPVPPSDLKGEMVWPTQPIPEKPAPFARQLLTYDELTDLSPEAHQVALNYFSRLRPHSPFQPPSREGTIIFPGFTGGALWGGAAVDPDGILYVNANDIPWVLTMVETDAGAGPAPPGPPALFRTLCAVCHGLHREGNPTQNVPALTNLNPRLNRDQIIQHITTGKGAMPSFAFLSRPQKEFLADFLLGGAADGNGHQAAPPPAGLSHIPYTHTGYNLWQDSQGYPAVKPPWGTLNAIDLNTGEYRWRVPLGEYPELTARGIPQTGTENYGGPVVTAGGLIFIAATHDECIRAFDQKTGRELWKARLPAGGYATPATYLVNHRQFVVIACGGAKTGTKSGHAYVAFALPP